MSLRFTCRILLLFALAVVVYSQGPEGENGEGDGGIVGSKPETPAGVDIPKTKGIVGTLFQALWPLTDILLELFDSYLKNMYGKSLPCTLESFTPLKAECTDLKTA